MGMRWLNLIVVVLTGAVASASFGPVFGGWPGYWAAGGGLAVGLLVAVISAWRRWGVLNTVALGLAGYLGFVGVFALPQTTIAGFLPSLETLARGGLLIFQAWRDLLTVAIPASSFSGPAVVPFLTGLVCAIVAGRLVLLARHYLWAILPMGAFLLVGVLWGTAKAPLALPLGIIFAVTVLVWGAVRQGSARRAASSELGVEIAKINPVRRVGAGAAVLALAIAVALGVTPALAGTNDRFVLRHLVEPPLDLRAYASPLMGYRYLETDQKTITQFTISGLPTGARVRLAVMDAYDGIVYSVTDGSAGFYRAGAEIEPRQESTDTKEAMTTSVHVLIDQWTGVWLPGGGDLRGVSFSGEQASEQTQSLYYNSDTGTALVTTGVGAGDSYDLQLVLPPEVDRDALIDYGIRTVHQPSQTRIPDAVIKQVAVITEGAATAVEQVFAIEKALQQGFYSDGSDGQSLSGHNEARISALLGDPQMIGDDEQYSVAMALMLRHLGIPARVVMGFHPPEEVSVADEWVATGTDAHVWVEVPFNEVGWVAFDPTPDRDRQPETSVPKPQPKPRPQVQPPPIPPKEPLEVPQRLGDDAAEADDDWSIDWLMLRQILLGIAAAGLLTSPVWVLALVRAQRRRIRRNATLAADRLSGSWAEIVDTATDLGVQVDKNQTRREVAASLAERTAVAELPDLAAHIDYGVFGDGTPREEFVDQVWTQTAATTVAMRRGAARLTRLSWWVRPTSLARPAAERPNGKTWYSELWRPRRATDPAPTSASARSSRSRSL